MKPIATIPAPRSMYADLIKRLAPGYDPRHIEAFMRTQYGTLDHLSPRTFRREVALAVACIEEAGPEMAERVALSHGM